MFHNGDYEVTPEMLPEHPYYLLIHWSTGWAAHLVVSATIENHLMRVSVRRVYTRSTTDWSVRRVHQKPVTNLTSDDEFTVMDWPTLFASILAGCDITVTDKDEETHYG